MQHKGTRTHTVVSIDRHQRKRSKKKAIEHGKQEQFAKLTKTCCEDTMHALSVLRAPPAVALAQARTNYVLAGIVRCCRMAMPMVIVRAEFGTNVDFAGGCLPA